VKLLQLIEYNKIEIHESSGGLGILEQRTEIEIVICKLMRQRLINADLKHRLEQHEFQGLNTEQHSLIFAMIQLTKKNIHTLYKKCMNLTMTKSHCSSSSTNHPPAGATPASQQPYTTLGSFDYLYQQIRGSGGGMQTPGQTNGDVSSGGGGNST
jgi:uncharacterized membrane protein YgcG